MSVSYTHLDVYKRQVDKIGQVRDNIETYETNTNLKISEIENNCKIEIQ